MANPISITSFTGIAALFGAALIPAGSAFAADGCGSDATLVAPGICEVEFTSTPDSAWTPPAGVTKIQALLVGAGGAISGSQYAGGGGDVQLVELSPTGEVEVYVGLGVDGPYDSDLQDTVVSQGSTVISAAAGRQAGQSGSGIDTGNDSGDGAGGASSSQYDPGVGLVVNEIDPSTFTLFADDDRCFGGGGASSNVFPISGANDTGGKFGTATCGGGYLEAPDGAVPESDYLAWNGGFDLVIEHVAEPNSGGGAYGCYSHPGEGAGADGYVAIRYDAQLASTGFDATGSIVAGAALVAGGVATVVTRRRRASH